MFYLSSGRLDDVITSLPDQTVIITWKPSAQFPVSQCWLQPGSLIALIALLPASVLLKVKKYPRTTEAALK